MDVSRTLPTGLAPLPGKVVAQADRSQGAVDAGVEAGRRDVDVGGRVVARALAGGQPPIDQDRVMALRLALAEGSYRIDPQALAAAMIARDLP